ncbi:hypothetical protein N9878_00830 [bacterium]|nr:hypothetical protein [bacterium]
MNNQLVQMDSALTEIKRLQGEVDALKIIAEEVAHIGVDFGFGKYQIALDSPIIEIARNLLTQGE